MLKKVDLVVVGMIIIYSCEEVIDFIKFFWNFGIIILFWKFMVFLVELFKFLFFFIFELWVYVFVVYIVVSVMMFVIVCLMLYEWDNFYLCDVYNEVLEN